MENNCRIVAVLAVLAFLSSPPTLSGQRIQGQAVDQYLKKLYKRIEKVIDIIDMGSTAYDVLKNLEISDSTEERSQLPGVIPSGFFLNFTVGSSSQQKEVTALMSLSSVFTMINNPIYSGTLQCCNLANPNSCGPAAQPGNNLPYTPCLNSTFRPADQFLFYTAKLDNVMYKWSGARNQEPTTGVISLSRSNYSLINHFRYPAFSYCISFTNSNFQVGDIPISGTLQSTKLLDNYQHLYAVNLTGISVGETTVHIYPTTVIIDTIIPVTLLEAAVYDAVKRELELKKVVPKNISNEQLLCYDINSKFDWPALYLFFPSLSGGSARMVLTKNNYVYTDPSTNSECAAIFRSKKKRSVIGSMAQLDREMFFDVKRSVLQFSQSSVSRASGETKPSNRTYPSAYAVEMKPRIQLSLVVLFFFFMFLG